MQNNILDIPQFNCPHCTKPLNGVQAGAPDPGRPPAPGDKGACIGCGSVLFFDEGKFILGTQGDLDGMPSFIRVAFEKAAGLTLVAQLPDKQKSLRERDVQNDGVLAGLAVISISKKFPLSQRVAFFTHLYTNYAANFSDEEWQRLMAYEPKPCGQAECRCHEREAATIESFKAFMALEPKKKKA